MLNCVGRSLGYLQSRSNCFDPMIESPGNVGSETGSGCYFRSERILLINSRGTVKLKTQIS